MGFEYEQLTSRLLAGPYHHAVYSLGHTEWVVVLRYAAKIESTLQPGSLNHYISDCLVPTIQGPTLEQAVARLERWVLEIVRQLDRPRAKYCPTCRGAGVVMVQP